MKRKDASGYLRSGKKIHKVVRLLYLRCGKKYWWWWWWRSECKMLACDLKWKEAEGVLHSRHDV